MKSPLPDGINDDRLSIVVGGKERPFTRMEWVTLTALRDAAGRVATFEYVARRLWPVAVADWNKHRISDYVRKVRLKLRGSGYAIQTRCGIGWIFEKVK